MGYVQHRLPATPGVRGGPTRPVHSAWLRADSSLVLTRAGLRFGAEWLTSVPDPCDPAAADGTAAWPGLNGLVPRYEPGRRLLRWGVHVIKRFTLPAPNQELLLLAAEEQGWPEWFDDPLPRGRGTAEQGLRNTIKDVNRRQRVPLVHFKGDGTATRAGWELR